MSGGDLLDLELVGEHDLERLGNFAAIVVAGVLERVPHDQHVSLGGSRRNGHDRQWERLITLAVRLELEDCKVGKRMIGCAHPWDWEWRSERDALDVSDPIVSGVLKLLTKPDLE